MLVKQLSAFVENKPGKAAAATAALAQAGVNIRAMSIGDSTTFGVVRLIVDDLEKGSEALKNINITTSVNEVLAVHMDDKPGSLNKILETIGNGGVSVEYLYAFVSRETDSAAVIIRTEDGGSAKAAELLEKANIRAAKI